MGKEFLPVFLDFNETTQDLSDEQCGRLIRALVDYANGKDCDLNGMELMAFRFLKGSIDRNAKLSAVRAEAGRSGGKQTQAKAIKSKQAQANESKGKQNAINNDNDINININSDSKSFLDDDEAAGIQREHDLVFTAAEDAGFKMSNTVRASLIRLYSEHGLEKLLSGINECVTHGAVNLAYLEAVLKGKPKQQPVKIVPAHQYEQRDYTDVQGEMMAEQDREMAEFLRNRNIG